MSDASENQSNIELPTEILIQIFSLLPAKKLIKCQEVCVRWKEIIDGLYQRETLWWKHCKKDFPSIINVANRKKRAGVTSFELYRSLTLWPKLESANHEIDEFASASTGKDEILGFSVIRNSIIGVLTQRGLVYYNLETLQPAKRKSIRGQYLKHIETDDTLIMMNGMLHLCIVRTVVRNPSSKRKAYIEDVKQFMLLKNQVYIINIFEEIRVCNLESENLETEVLVRLHQNIISIGHMDDQIYILTYNKTVFLIRNKMFFEEFTIDSYTNLLDTLRRYNFLEQMDWRLYYKWISSLQLKVPLSGPLCHIVIVKCYGDVYFIGNEWGIFQVYYAPYTNDRLDFHNKEPDKQFNFAVRSNGPLLSISTILDIDVLEAKNGHSVVVAMPKKIAVINFTHNFRVTESVAILPSDELEIQTPVMSPQ